MTDASTIRRLDAAEMAERLSDLSELLIDCVDGGASISFMHPLTREAADVFWLGIRDRVATGTTEVLIAECEGALAGTVQIVAAEPENQPHRADIAKMLVHRRARRRGIGQALMQAAEHLACAKGKTLLVLDTADAGAARLYARQNWTRVGQVPGYALLPDGRPCDTIIFYKKLPPSPGTG